MMTLEEIRQRLKAHENRSACLSQIEATTELFRLVGYLASHLNGIQKQQRDPMGLETGWTWTCGECGNTVTGREPPMPFAKITCPKCNPPKTRGQQIAEQEIVHNGIACDRQDRFLIRPSKSPQASVFAGTNAIEDRDLAAKKFAELRETVAVLIDAAIAEEREACAYLAEGASHVDSKRRIKGVCYPHCRLIAAAIRART